MAKDFLDEFDEIDGVEAETVEQAPPAEPEAPASEPEPPAAEELPTEAPPTTVSVPVTKPEPGFVPFGAVLDERDKRKKLEAELETLRQQRQPAEPTPLPDMFEDPEGYTAGLAQTFEQKLYAQSLQMSERFARNQYGDETTEAALAWATQKCDADPYFNAQVKQSGDPVGYAVQQYQRDQITQAVTPDDFKQFIAWKEAQAGLQQQPAPAAQTPPSPQSLPPRSLASAPSAGPATVEPVLSEEEDFAEVFKRK